MIKNLTALLLFTLLSACGAPSEHVARGIEEQSGIILRADNLVGLTVQVDQGAQTIISKSDLMDYRMGVLGSADRDIEGLDAIFLNLPSGNHSVVVRQNGVSIFERTIYLSNSQIRDFRL